MLTRHANVMQTQYRAEPCGSYGAKWYCVQTHSQAESIAAYELDRQGYRIFFPRFVDYEAKSHPIRTLFPGYGFVQFSIENDRWRPICSTRGVKRLFCMRPDVPAPVRDAEIDYLISRCRSGDGLIDSREDLPDLTNATVLIKNGAFEGKIGICSLGKTERLEILFDMMGPQTIQLDRADVERV